MLIQMKYAFKDQLSLRGIALLMVVAGNLILKLLSHFGAGFRTEVPVSAFLLLGMMGSCLICDIDAIKSLYHSPAGYLPLLTPPSARQKLAARAIVIVIGDILCISCAVLGLFIQLNESSRYFGEFLNFKNNVATVFSLLKYIRFILALFLGAAVSRSYLHSTKFSIFLSFVTAILSIYVLNLLDLVLVPFGHSVRIGISTEIIINVGLNLPFIIYLLLHIIKIAVLYLAAAYLTERKINL